MNKCKICGKEIKGYNVVTFPLLTIIHFKINHKGIETEKIKQMEKRLIRALLLTPIALFLIGLRYFIHPIYLLHEKIDDIDGKKFFNGG